jgi:hypothetical protein
MLKRMMTGKRFLEISKGLGALCLLILSSILLSGCRGSMPPIELCIVGDSGCICNDPRLPVGRQEYVISFSECRNYIATNPKDYQDTQEWVIQRCGK